MVVHYFPRNAKTFSLESLQYGINRFIFLHSADGKYAINIYRGGNIVSITAGSKGKKCEFAPRIF